MMAIHATSQVANQVAMHVLFKVFFLIFVVYSPFFRTDYKYYLKFITPVFHTHTNN